MKKYFIALFGLLAMSTISCTKEEVPTVETISPVGEKITVTAYVGGNDTRVSSSFENDQYTFAWEGDDAFSVIGNNDNQPFTKANTGDNKFIGTCPAAINGNYYAIYPVTASTDYAKATFDISNQNDAAAYVLYSETDNISTFDFRHAMAYLRFRLPDEFDGERCDITITTPTGVFTNGEINLENGTLDYTNSTKNYIKLNRQIDKDNPLLVAIPPMETGNKSLTFGIKKGDDYYEATLNGDPANEIVAGKYYTASIALEEKIPYLTFTVGGEQSLVLNVMGEMDQSIEYSADGGEWGNFEISGDVGEYDLPTTVSVLFTKNLRMRGKSASGTVDFETYKGFMISFTENTPVTCSGDIRTLVDYTNYETTSTANACFSSLFVNCSALADASKLELISNNNEMAASCYEYMFSGCTSLTSAPALPATTLAEGCYKMMFAGCTSLRSAPELPAEELAVVCYSGMFNTCTSLESAPALPATTLASSCYLNMFLSCSNLTTAPAQLPATTLADNCYSNMFARCSKLISAPVLPAETLVKNCYWHMFEDCTNLNSVTMLATDIAATGCLTNWMEGVAATGTFIKAASMESLPTDSASGIPEGWTVNNYGQSEN